MNNILDYLEMTAEKTIWKTGIDGGDICMSWKELADLSRKAGTAFSKRTQPGKPVAILMEKSAAALAAMFGAVYAGCFYAVIDPCQPEERIMEIFHVLSPDIIVVENREVEERYLNLFQGKAVSFTDCLHEEADLETLENIRKASTEDDLLYCLFTSGH